VFQACYANPHDHHLMHFRVSLFLLIHLPDVGNTLGGFSSHCIHSLGVGNMLGGCASNWHSFAPALATCSAAAPRIGIPSPQRRQHAWGLLLEFASLRSCVGNTLGGCTLQPDASNARGLRLHANLSIHYFCTRC
jgi:hypothetical protein